MSITRFHLLMIMILCAIVIAIVAVVSLYVPGSHDWKYDYDSPSSEKCPECHDEVETEILSMPGGSPHRAGYVSEGCSYCHLNSTVGFTQDNHTGLIPECQDCHPTTEPERDGDNEYGTQNITAPYEAHFPLYDNATSTDHDPGKNRACMACHTRVDVKIRFNRPQWYNFTISSAYAITSLEQGPQFDGGNFNISYSTSDLGKHYYLDYKDCGSSGGCHQDVQYSRIGGISGGHQSNISSLHPSDTDCTTCHWDEDPTKDYHAARSINCTYSGCHAPIGQNMTTLFGEIDSNVGKNARGDICWGCHSGYDWIDPGAGLTLQVETERNYNVSFWTGSGWQKIYPDPNVNCSSCHNDSLPNVPPIPATSGKYIHHNYTGVYGFGSDGSSGCLQCHDEAWAPHDNPHDINITYVNIRANMGNNFCNSTCHYSIIDSRAIYRGNSTDWMKDITTSFESSDSLHETSTLINSSGTVQCWDCHPDHEIRPFDGGLSVPGCGATNLNVSCHVPDQAWANKTDTPSSHGANWVVAGRDNCIESGCHDKHNYTLDPSAGHDPKAGSCHGTGGDGGCEPSSKSHPIHIDSTNSPSGYYECNQCHWDTVSDPSEADGTFGTALHMNDVVNVNFDTTSNGIATYGGVLSGGSLPTYEGGNGSCSGTYCHSNAYDVGGSGFKTYESPDWDGGSVYCGDCHGIPNYYNGTAWREMGGTVTGNSPTHLKHTRNFGGINSTRHLFWFDAGPSGSGTPPYGWNDSIYDSGEAIIQDLNNNRMLDWGVLNGSDDQSATPPASPDNVYVNGTADLTDFVSGDNIKYWDANNDGNWDRDEDMYVETGGGGNAGDEWNPSKGDYLIYVGVTQDIVANDNTYYGDYLTDNTNEPVMYLDSDHDNLYDNWYNSGLTEYSGVEEPLILVQTNKATGGNIDNTDEVLRNTGMYLYYYADTNRWYDFDCSECHYESSTDTGGVSTGNGTYDSIAHVNMSVEVKFDITANGIASKNGTYTTQASHSDAWNSTSSQCYGIWCHSDGYERDDTDNSPPGNGYPDWSGTGIYDDTNYDYHTIKPNWTDTSRSTVWCGSCHYSDDKPSDISNAYDRPNTGGHRKVSQHSGASQFGWHIDDDAVLCMECHWRYDTYGTSNENQWWRPYGSDAHVDGGVWIWPTGTADGAGLFGPLSESQGYTSGCHNTWPGGWQKGYPGAC
jgi:predicted CxxxxCH...CXXCH cytochrome family protein